MKLRIQPVLKSNLIGSVLWIVPLPSPFLAKFPISHTVSRFHTLRPVRGLRQYVSVVRIDKSVAGVSGKARIISFYVVAVIPVGDIANLTEATNTAAELNSFCSTTGAATTVLFDGTGYGTAALLNGSL